LLHSLKGTDWGDLDILLLDMPPGTGDVQLAVLQELQLSGAVAVSTPSKLAAADTRKGMEMFTSLGVPTLAVVENMAYFEVRRFAGWSAGATRVLLTISSCVGGRSQTLPIRSRHCEWRQFYQLARSINGGAAPDF
jgi:MinD superfamily P-loop ATPase